MGLRDPLATARLHRVPYACALTGSQQLGHYVASTWWRAGSTEPLVTPRFSIDHRAQHQSLCHRLTRGLRVQARSRAQVRRVVLATTATPLLQDPPCPFTTTGENEFYSPPVRLTQLVTRQSQSPHSIPHQTAATTLTESLHKTVTAAHPHTNPHGPLPM